MRTAVIEKVEQMQLRKEVPNFSIGDSISVHIRIVEGDKERTQIFTGTVIARRGTGLGETFALHRVAYGEGMERVFLLHSPRIAKIELVKRGRVRRAKLYYLRGTSGKKAKVRNLLGGRKEVTTTTKRAGVDAEVTEAQEASVEE